VAKSVLERKRQPAWHDAAIIPEWGGVIPPDPEPDGVIGNEWRMVMVSLLTRISLTKRRKIC
jgi:hypothetical protein